MNTSKVAPGKRGYTEHQLTSIDVVAKTADCAACGRVYVQKRGKQANGKQRWMCSIHSNEKSRKDRLHTQLIVKDKCWRCGFLPEDLCQLDIDHIDGNHHNNNIENLQVLCANCHRLKTRNERQYTKLGLRP